MKTTKPNVRKMFVPDPGYIMLEIDLKQADAQIVAWEAQDEPLMDLFEKQARGELINGKPIDIHTVNALDIFGPSLQLDAKGRAPHAIRQISKSGVHGTNYAASPYTLAQKLGVQIAQMKRFQAIWFQKHPAILNWHKAVEFELMTTRSVTNVFGYRCIFNDRVEELLPEALAWKPQSTVALIIDQGMDALDAQFPFIQILLQVHDSCLFQCPKELATPENLELFKQCFLVPLPYPRPLTIGVDLKASEVSWGECE